MRTVLIVTPETARRFREKQLNTLLIPLLSPQQADFYCGLVRFENHIRMYFNNYQLGFNFKLRAHVGFKEDFKMAHYQIYVSDKMKESCRPGLTLSLSRKA